MVDDFDTVMLDGMWPVSDARCASACSVVRLLNGRHEVSRMDSREINGEFVVLNCAQHQMAKINC